jgi:membrane peptidoglycan carboxypeptidase
MPFRRPLVALALLIIPILVAAGMVVEGYVRAPGVVARQMADHPIVLRSREVAPDRMAALLAVEDPAFHRHHGVDLMTPGAGLTTITQGLVKFLYFENFRPGIAKLRQTLLAVGFDARVPKEEQLDFFLNWVYLGTVEGKEVIGFDQAARFYHGRPFEQLSSEQFLSLLAMCAGPDEFSVAQRPEQNRDRVRRIENLLAGRCRPSGVRDVYYQRCAGQPQGRD